MGSRLRARTSRLAAPAAVLVAGLVLASCSGYSGGIAHQVGQWASGADVTTNDGYITTDVGEIANGVKLAKLTATHTACDGLASDAGTAYGELPTPDSSLTSELNTAYLDFTAAAEDCSAASSFTGDRFRDYRREEALAAAALDRAERRLRSLGDG